MHKCIRVDFPGFIKNIDNALNYMGGLNNVKESLLSEEKTLSFNFRPDDSFSQPNYSTVRNEYSFLLKIKCKRKFAVSGGKKQQISVDFYPEIVCITPKTIYFDRPSDFQFLPPLNSHYNNQTVENPPKFKFLFLPPKVFFRASKYDSYYIQRKIFATQSDKTKFWKTDKCPWIVKHSDLNGLKYGPQKTENSDDVKEEVLDVVTKMFEERPVWTALALNEYLLKNHNDMIKKYNITENCKLMYAVLSSVGYYITDGPFNLCWVRYGINPIYNHDTKHFQPINISLKGSRHADKIIEYISGLKKGKNRDEYMIGFSSLSKVPHKLLFSLQICDLKEKYINDKRNHFLHEFNETSGWYSKEDLGLMRKFCMIKLKRMLDNNYVESENMMNDIKNDDDIDMNSDDEEEYDSPKIEIPAESSQFAKEVSSIIDSADFDFIETDVNTLKFHINNVTSRLFNY